VSVSPVGAQQGGAAQGVVISEVVSANTVQVDVFAESSDWIELHNKSGSSVNLAGWTIADNGSVWEFPATSLGADQRLIVWASNRDISSPQLHANFKLSASDGETLVLSNASGVVVDTLDLPPLRDNDSFGRDDNTGEAGYMIELTFRAPNSGLTPGAVQFVTTPQSFTGNLNVALNASLDAGERIRFTTDGSEVSATSTLYSAPVRISLSTVFRAAVVGNGVVGPETSGGYVAVSADIANDSSDLPIVLVSATGDIKARALTDAVVSVIDREADGRARVLGEGDYSGFGGLRVRGASSLNFDKQQYKFELWEDTDGTEVGANLLDLGTNSDWGLYAPGYNDRAMINNPLMYQLADNVGVTSIDYQFVELYLQTNNGEALSQADYQGLYLLRESIKIDDNRVDLTEHTPISSGDEGGYIIRYDWGYANCCEQIADHPQFHSEIQLKSPGRFGFASDQRNWAKDFWADLQGAAATRQFNQVEPYIDFEDTSFIDAWLLTILAKDFDLMRASYYMNLDAGGKLRGGPLWDFDRSMGSADYRTKEATGWGWSSGLGGHSFESDIFLDLWETPEIKGMLIGRWQQLRGNELSDANIGDLIDELGSEIGDAYVRDAAVWDGPNYGSRYGDLNGELEHLSGYLQTRIDWLDEQFVSNAAPPVWTNPGTLAAVENQPFSRNLQATNAASFRSESDLPAGLTLNSNGRIAGTVAYGDGGTYVIEVTATSTAGASSSITFNINVGTPFGGTAKVLLNEYNAVGRNEFLKNDGTDTTLGTIVGNGGDWFELVTIEDNLDMRGWQFELWSEESGIIAQQSALTLGQQSRLTGISAGTIITVAESIPDDLSYNPANGDWTLNFQANDTRGSVFSAHSNFDTNHDKWRMVIRDASGTVVAPIAGETEPWDDANGGLGKDEVFALEADPAPGIVAATSYTDTNESTFGAPNPDQNFTALRNSGTSSGDDIGIINAATRPEVGQNISGARFLVQANNLDLSAQIGPDLDQSSRLKLWFYCAQPTEICEGQNLPTDLPIGTAPITLTESGGELIGTLLLSGVAPTTTALGPTIVNDCIGRWMIAVDFRTPLASGEGEVCFESHIPDANEDPPPSLTQLLDPEFVEGSSGIFNDFELGLPSTLRFGLSNEQIDFVNPDELPIGPDCTTSWSVLQTVPGSGEFTTELRIIRTGRDGRSGVNELCITLPG